MVFDHDLFFHTCVGARGRAVTQTVFSANLEQATNYNYNQSGRTVTE